MKRIFTNWIILTTILLSCVNAYSDISFSGSAYNETSLINRDDSLRYGNRSALHLKGESLSEGIKLVSELEFYMMYGYLSSLSSGVSESMKDGRFYIDRLYMKFPVRKVDIVLGKQRIAWGNSILFKPTDTFNNPNPLSLSGRKEGINALYAKAFLNDLSELELVIAPADKYERINDEVNLEHLRYSKFASRLSTNFHNSDMAFSYQYNGSEKNHILGLDMKGDIKLGYHVETTFTYNKKSFKTEDFENFLQSVLGLDYSFNGKWIVLGEYFYNGRELKNETKLSDSSFDLLEDFKYRHYLYSQVVYQYDIFFKANLFAIMNMVDKSLIISPGIDYDLFQNTDLQVYSQIFVGDENDEFSPSRLGVNQVFYMKLTIKF